MSPGQDDDAHVAPGPRMLDGGHQDAGSLGPFGNQFSVRTAFPEKLFRMRGLEIFQAYLALRNVGGDGQHGSVAPVGVKQAVDQMEVAGTAAAAADGPGSRSTGLPRSRQRLPPLHAAHGSIQWSFSSAAHP